MPTVPMTIKLWQAYLVAMVAVDAIYNSVAKYWSLHPQRWQLPVVCFILMGGMNLLFLSSLADGAGIARAAVWFGVLSAGAGAALGVFFFHEALSPQQGVGLVLGLVALWLLR